MLLTVWMLFGINKFMQKSTWIYCCCSVAKSCLTLGDPTYCSMLGFCVLHYLPKFAQTCPLSQWCHPTISSFATPFSSCPQSFPGSGYFPMGWLFQSGSHSIVLRVLKRIPIIHFIFYHWCYSHSLNIHWMFILCLELFTYYRHKNEKQYSSSLHWV